MKIKSTMAALGWETLQFSSAFSNKRKRLATISRTYLLRSTLSYEKRLCVKFRWKETRIAQLGGLFRLRLFRKTLYAACAVLPGSGIYLHLCVHKSRATTSGTHRHPPASASQVPGSKLALWHLAQNYKTSNLQIYHDVSTIFVYFKLKISVIF